MATNNGIIPVGLLEHLKLDFPLLTKLASKEQFWFTWMVWQGHHDFRQHRHHEDAMSFHHTELYRWFGKKKFEVMNEEIGLFKLSANWSVARNETRAFWMSEKLKSSMETFTGEMAQRVTGVLREDGKQMHKVPNPLRSTSSVPKSKQVSVSVINKTNLNRVQINCLQLRVLSTALSKELKAYSSPDFWPHQRSRDATYNVKIFTDKLLMLAESPYGGTDRLVHVYIECASGRVYATGLNLQNAPRIVKAFALAGHWNYDIQNCHFSVINQMVEPLGYECKAIRDYLARKDQLRKSIASQVDIPVSRAKQCLLAMMYGARMTLSKGCAIPREIGTEKAKILYAIPEFSDLAAEIKKCRKIIVDHATKNGRCLPKNAFGKTLQAKSTTSQILSHQINGVERCALEAAISVCKDDVLLLQHDALVSRKRLDVKVIEEKIFQKTGYHLAISETQIQPKLKDFLQNQ
jgi:hypothetical protein